jgi:tetratricopeptide (TPR) repeat protein
MTEHKSVFISYRRTNIYIARAVYQDLRANGYDVFLDYQSIDSGDFSQVILNQIAARAHFVLILTPSALERCVNSDDMMRLEIEYAIDQKRNFVPLTFEGFDYKLVTPYLVTDKLKLLPKYNGLPVPDTYFEEAMIRLRTRFLSLPLEGIIHPTPPEDKATVIESIQQAIAAPEPTSEQLKAEEYFERGVAKSRQSDYNEAIEDYTQAIALNPQFAEAYFRRGNAYLNRNEEKKALRDYKQALRLAPDDRLTNSIQSQVYRLSKDYDRALAEAEQGVQRNPEYDEAYFMRGLVRIELRDYDGAISDNTEAIRLNPQYVMAYNNRGVAHKYKGDYDSAINDFTDAIRINPKHALAYRNRGIARNEKSDYDGAIADFTEAIRLTPRDADAYYTRGQVRSDKGDLDKAIADFEAALIIDPDYMSAKKSLDLVQKMKKG